MLTADSRALTERHFAAVGAEGIPVVVEGMQNATEFSEVILKNMRNQMDTDLVQVEVMQAATRLKSRNPDMGALVLECTDLPPYAAEIQKLLRIPVFDLTTLATMAHNVVTRMPYRGIMPW